MVGAELSLGKFSRITFVLRDGLLKAHAFRVEKLHKGYLCCPK